MPYEEHTNYNCLTIRSLPNELNKIFKSYVDFPPITERREPRFTRRKKSSDFQQAKTLTIPMRLGVQVIGFKTGKHWLIGGYASFDPRSEASHSDGRSANSIEDWSRVGITVQYSIADLKWQHF